jgi:cation transport protein ChaC
MFALTAELIDRFHETINRPQTAPTVARLSDEDVDAIVLELLTGHPADMPIHVFAYGSLLWNPAFVSDAEQQAVALGWHRAFRMRQTSWRGSPDNPGLMMVLDRGGSCRGILMSVGADKREAAVRALIRREMSTRTTANQPRWIAVNVAGRREKAIAFCINRASNVYSGRQTESDVAATLARAFGPAGSCAEYLYKTITALEEREIGDKSLMRLQSQVAKRIANMISA